MASILDGYEVLDPDKDYMFEGQGDDSEYFEHEMDETAYIAEKFVKRDMWHDFDQIDPNDIPMGFDEEV